MKSFAFLLILGLIPMEQAFSRPKTFTVTVNDNSFVPSSLNLRESSAKATKFVPTCWSPDFLQEKFPWKNLYPWSFYFEATASEIEESKYQFAVPAPTVRSRLCQARTDNVANNIVFDYKNELGETVANGYLQYTIEANGQDATSTQCNWFNDEEGNPVYIQCQPVVFSEKEDLNLEVIFQK